MWPPERLWKRVCAAGFVVLGAASIFLIWKISSNTARDADGAKKRSERLQDSLDKNNEELRKAQFSLEFVKGQMSVLESGRGEEARILEKAIEDSNKRIFALQGEPRESLKRRAELLYHDLLDFLKQRRQGDPTPGGRLGLNKEQEQAQWNKSFAYSRETVELYSSRYSASVSVLLQDMAARNPNIAVGMMHPLDAIRFMAAEPTNPVTIEILTMDLGVLAKRVE